MLTLEYDGVEKAFAPVGAIPGWGIAQSGCGLTRTNGQSDIYRFRIPVVDAATAPVFDEMEPVIIRRGRAWGGSSFSGGVIVFVGYRLPATHDIQGGGEYIHYTFSNPWYWLAQTPFQQPTAAYVASDFGFQFQTSLIFYTKISEGNAVDPDEDMAQLPGFLLWITNGKQIREILEHALEMYDAPGFDAPFQIGTVDPNVALPSYAMQEIDCAAGILAAMQVSPECTVNWDYATTPPTINVKARGNLTPVDLAIRNGTDFMAMNLMPVDNTPSVVIIYFRIIGTVDGDEFVQLARQKYGPNGANHVDDPEGGLNAVIQTVDLAGPSYVNGYLKTREVVAYDQSTPLADPNVAEVRAWWASVKPELADARYRYTSFDNTKIYEVNADGTKTLLDLEDTLAALPYMLEDGSTIEPWMKVAGDPIAAKRVVIETEWIYTEYDEEADGIPDVELSNNGRRKREVPCHKLSWSGTITNGTTGSYSATTSAGESIPENLALNIWNSLSVPQFAGTHTIVESEITGQIGMNNTLNLTGGFAAWATMAATIQSIHEDDGTGHTTITFGATEQLNAGELSEIWRWNRFRRPSTNLTQREDAKA